MHDRVGGRRLTALRSCVVAIAGVLACWAGALAFGVDPDQWQVDVAILVGLLVVAGLARLLRVSAGAAAVAAVVCVLAGGGLVVLHGTAWAYSGIYSDAGFRTEAITRFADTRALVDYAYAGLPTYYPPALSWLQGLVAHLLDVPAWRVMKPSQLVISAAIPAVAWWWWRRLLPPTAAGCVAAVVAVMAAEPYKPDEWLVLTVILPWWLELVGGVRRRGAEPAPALFHGVVLGLLALCHTFFFAPLALASVVSLVLERVMRHPAAMTLRRVAVVVVTGLLVASPYWVPLVLLRLRGAPSDDLQMRWSPRGFELPPMPDLLGGIQALGFLGLVWMVWNFRRDRMARGLLIVWVTALGYVVLGQVAQRWGVAVLPEKAVELCVATLAAAGVLALFAWVPHGRRFLRGRAPGWASVALSAGLVVATVLGLEIVHGRVQAVLYRTGQMAQHMRYPDGTWAAGGPPPLGSTVHPWGVTSPHPGASTDEILDQWRSLSGHPLGSRDVIVSARGDVLATTPAHAFITYKSIYSHPNGEFTARLDWLRRVSRCPDPSCARRLLRENRFDAVDGLVLDRDRHGLYLPLALDDFPEAWHIYHLRFDSRLFAAPYFRIHDLDHVSVVAVQPAAG